ncbi:MAG: hypothetical protein COA57_13795 [Flavobacteriales bacterium]|nr:MAG: hypothetical protein COA57_13795 [Flavobacteriales bacterium]
MSNKIDKYKTKLEKAEKKIGILEGMIENRTRELYTTKVERERQNKELEQFAYIASHDLQEPLRTVTGLVELLQQEYKGQLDENADRHIQYITESISRMDQLVKGLLGFSRIGRERTLSEVNCNTVIKAVINDADHLIKETGTHITYSKLPSIIASEIELRQLFQNLIHNAIKFRKKDAAPKIEISAIKKVDIWEFAIKDNGIGIDQKNHDKIFMIFKCLHTRGQYKGTGIGLANCKKIIELHDGKIWLDSEPDKGSTFYFTIPN